jgi:hypothetical protein
MDPSTASDRVRPSDKTIHVSEDVAFGGCFMHGCNKMEVV